MLGSKSRRRAHTHIKVTRIACVHEDERRGNDEGKGLGVVRFCGVGGWVDGWWNGGMDGVA